MEPNQKQDNKTKDNGPEINRIYANGTAVREETIPVWYIKSKNAIYYVLGFIEVSLALRFIFMLLGANAGSGFTIFLYAISGILAAPFTNVFNPMTTTGLAARSVFDPATLVAMIIYALIAWGLVRLLWVKVSKNGHW